MQLDADMIARRLPHTGDMCLLDGAQVLDGNKVHAYAQIGDLHKHPLADNGSLGVFTAVEYAAQAAAIGQAADANDTNIAARGGYLVQIKNLQKYTDVIEAGRLVLDCECIASQDSGAMYQVVASMANKTLLNATIVLAFH